MFILDCEEFWFIVWELVVRYSVSWLVVLILLVLLNIYWGDVSWFVVSWFGYLMVLLEIDGYWVFIDLVWSDWCLLFDVVGFQCLYLLLV